jgi:hypothetical protein
MRYDPEKPPAPEVWETLDETEAELMIEQHHRSPRCPHPPAPDPELHASMHLIVENQAAVPDLPVAAALARLVADGLTRHEAVHAVGSVVSRHLFAAVNQKAKPDIDQYYEEVAALTADAWLRSAETEPETPNRFAMLDDDALIDLLFTQGDRLPREAVDEVIARSASVTDRLIAIVVDPRAWDAPLPKWWAPVHATFILATNDDPGVDAALLSALRHAAARDDESVLGAMPVMLAERGARLRPTLLRILADRTERPGVRRGAIDGLAAGTLVDPDCRDEVFARIGEVFTMPSEDRRVRKHAGVVLLDFQVRAFEQALRDFEAEGETFDDLWSPFDGSEVDLAFSVPQDTSRSQDSWLDFYDADLIAGRQHPLAARGRRARERERQVRTPAKVGRNEPCPCGSGRKYKKCCLGA